MPHYKAPVLTSKIISQVLQSKDLTVPHIEEGTYVYGLIGEEWKDCVVTESGHPDGSNRSRVGVLTKPAAFPGTNQDADEIEDVEHYLWATEIMPHPAEVLARAVQELSPFHLKMFWSAMSALGDIPSTENNK